MKSQTAKIIDVDSYISSFPEGTAKLLGQLRAIIVKTAPEADEVISYNMPAYKFHGMLIYFSGYEHHIGLYPMPDAVEAFKKELSIYKTAKGSVQLPLDKPLPVALIKKIVAFRKKQNLEKAAIKTIKK